MTDTEGPADHQQADRFEPRAVPSSNEVTIRRAPKFGVFIIGGALLGVIAAIVIVSVTMGIDRGSKTETVGFWGLVGYFSLWGIPIGFAIGAIVAVILDRVYVRRAARLTAERVAVELPPEEADGFADAEVAPGEDDRP